MCCSVDSEMGEKERNEMEMAMELRLVLQETLTACLVAAEAATVDGSEQRSDICDRGTGPQSEKKAKMAPSQKRIGMWLVVAREETGDAEKRLC